METELYGPLKVFFEALGFAVKGEVQGCDLVAVRGEETVVVELKPAFNLALVFQGIDRQRLTETVYLAIEAPRRNRGARWDEVRHLCRRLGLGLITVDLARPSPRVEVVCDPEPALPRRSKQRRTLLLQEFGRRSGDHNTGGMTRRPIITAYREDALRLALRLQQQGPGKPAALRKATGIEKAAATLQRNVYGWFERLERGLYGLSPEGATALERYADLVREYDAQAKGRENDA